MGARHTGPAFSGPVFTPPSAEDPATLAGHRISARLGAGALGRVYFAHAPGGQPVALTVIRPELAARPGFAARFHHDTHALRRVRGPAVVPVLGSGADGPLYWIAAAYVPAVALHHAVAAAGPLPVPVVLRLVAGIAEGLRTLHHAGVVHRDLRPAQVLLAADGPRLKGYGLAASGDADLAAGTTAANAVPVFLSPEQAAGKPVTAATDVYALGQIAAYAAIGAPPFGDGPAHTVVPRVLQEEPDLSELPGELREIVTRCLIKAPALRPSPAQIIAMCGQASPGTALRGGDPWLPPALLAAIVPAMPPPAPPIPPAPPRPAAAPRPGAGWAPPHRPRPAAYVRLPYRRGGGSRTIAGIGAVAALAVAVTAGLALAGGLPAGLPGGGDGGDGGGHRPAATTAPGAPVPTGDGDGTLTGDGKGGAATGGSEAAPGGVYRAIELPAGYAVSLSADPPAVLPGSLSGSFGYTEQGDAFATDGRRALLALLAPDLPGTLAGCRALDVQAVAVPRGLVSGGTRLCVRSADGSTALVTFRQLTAQGAPDPYATFDVTVWRTP